jgi:hypothetical protein
MRSSAFGFLPEELYTLVAGFGGPYKTVNIIMTHY